MGENSEGQNRSSHCEHAKVKPTPAWLLQQPAWFQGQGRREHLTGSNTIGQEAEQVKSHDSGLKEIKDADRQDMIEPYLTRPVSWRSADSGLLVSDAYLPAYLLMGCREIGQNF